MLEKTQYWTNQLKALQSWIKETIKCKRNWQPLRKSISYGFDSGNDPGSDHNLKSPDASGMLQAATNHGKRDKDKPTVSSVQCTATSTLGTPKSVA